jgi:hypothetical protein
MDATANRRIMTETAQARDQAEAVLRGLLEARVRTESALPVKGTTTKPGVLSGVELAITSTERLVASYDRVLGRLQNALSDDDLALLDELGLPDDA